MRRLPIILLLVSTIATLACGAVRAQGLLPDSTRTYYRGLLDERRRSYAALEAEVFSALTRTRTPDETDAMLFLLATSPIADLADRGGDFFLSTVRVALRTRATAPWGKNIPDPIFLHFVLPPRVGSEAIDSSRLVFPTMLAARLGSRGMRAAVLEINHWCHEHVTYAPSDARTRAPLATMRNAKGRCGEESVFTTTALRAAGIPARQVYVPRWAHADDNHAWVEVWVDGVWHFLGACEPEADLDRAWFTEPARRAMLTAATTQGRYTGAEDVLFTTRLSTRINTLPVYAPTRVLTVQVCDPHGNPVAKARVDFSVFNYAEFFPLARITTDGSGIASLRTGSGDLLVWAHDSSARHVFALSTHERGDTLRLVLSDHVRRDGRIALDIHPPPATVLPVSAHPDAARTAARIRRGDSIRARYEATFVDSTAVAGFARTHGYSIDSCWLVLSHARGNGEEILDFLTSATRIEPVLALRFLRTLSEKDLQDASAFVLRTQYQDAMARRAVGDRCDDLYLDHVCAPRIGREELRPWREAIHAMIVTHPLLGEAGDDDARARRFASWIRDSIRIDGEGNWGGVPIPVTATAAIRAGDRYSRSLLFVAMCRAMGIPARLQPATGAPEYHAGGSWIDAGIVPGADAPTGHSRLVLRPRAGQRVESPVYGTHFTLARFDRGVYRTFDLEHAPFFGSWPAEVPLPAGEYMLVSGNRQPDGSVLAALEFLSLPDTSIREHDLIIRDDDAPPLPLGRIDAALLPERTAPAHILLWIARDTEPVSHALRDLAAERQSLDAHAVGVLLAGSDLTTDELRAIARRALPAGTRIASDGAGTLRAAVMTALHLSADTELPLLVVCDAAGNITFVSRGYSIGVGTQVLRMLERMHPREGSTTHD